ncbi:hypothetical protein V6N13_097464 [Hibiscus sabdariffa]
MGQHNATKKKQGIVFKELKGKAETMVGKEGSSDNRTMDSGREIFRLDRGKVTMNEGSHIRGAKRTLQGKKEVSNQFTTKRTK